MKLIDIINGPWAITPEMHREILGIYLTHLRGEKIDIKAIEARLGQPLVNEQKGYEVRDGTAIISVDGVLAKRMNMFTRISGGTSSELIAQDFKAALDDGAVEKILLLIDSPGGTVDGTEALAGLIHGSRGKKPLSALTDGQMASAAYWLGSAVDPGQLFISGDTVVTGSIGVVAAHVDKSEAEKKIGIKTTEITAGKYKRIASEFAPLTKEGREYLQDKVDYLYSIFVDTVAKHRGVAPSRALAMADGQVFIGKQGIHAGLVDGMKTLDEILSRPVAVAMGGFRAEGSAECGVRSAEVNAGAGALSAETTSTQEVVMNLTELKEKHPDIYQAAVADGKETGKTEGAAGELARIKAVHELGRKMPGHTAMIEGFMFDGKTDGPVAAMAVIEAEGGKRAATAAAIAADAADITVPAAQAPKEEGKKDFMALVEAHMKTKECSKGEAIRAMAAAHSDLHEAYIAQQKTGKTE